jgi:glycosyltransferase involved in cell wall biosynthesis
VRQQDYPLIEHIVIDGLSGDDTLGIVSKFPHVTKIISEKDKGIYDAMNKGIALATGEVIGILNSDDVYSDDRVLSAVAELFADDSVDVCYADLQYVEQDNTRKVLRTWRSGRYSRKSFYWGWMPPHPTFFVRRRVYDQVGLFNTTLRSSADYEMMLRILVKYDMEARYLPKVIVKMRAGGVSNASLRNRLRANREDRTAWKLNGLNPYFFTLLVKPLRKLPQYFIK